MTAIVAAIVASLVLMLNPVAGWAQTATSGAGQDFPNRPIRIVTSSPGSGSDFAARLIAQGLTERFGQQVLVDNRFGVAGVETASKAQPDGYTLYLDGTSFWVTPLLKTTPYDVLRDFSPVTLAVMSPNIVVAHPSLPANSIKELIALAKAKPGHINYGSAGTGSGQHLAAELFKSMAGTNIVHVPFKGIAIAITSLLGNEIQLIFATTATVMPHVKSNKLKALALCSLQPSPLFPGLPTVAATVADYEFAARSGIFTPGKPPPAIVTRLNQEIVRVLNLPDVREKFLNIGAEIVASSPQEFIATLRSEVARMGKVIREAGIKAD
jgi:tripartite-type tricarboxylate transporter receptor subunit TctC